MNGPLPPNAIIGIVGGGQLGRMAAMAAAKLGYRCHILTPEPDGPAEQVSGAVTHGDYEDRSALQTFASAVDVITFESENISAEGLDFLASLRPVRPSPGALRISQDRVLEKFFLNGLRMDTAPWLPVETMTELTAAVAHIGFPSVLKTTRFGYDGKGQSLLRTPADLPHAFNGLEPKPFILEGFVDFAAEISVLIARGSGQEVAVFDTVENRHREHVLDLSLAPAPIAESIADAAQTVARQIAEALDLVGLLAVEMFVDNSGRVLVNELAPRPHNSGHWTIDACPMSQFDLLVRAIAGLPLPPAIRHSDAVMKNLVGPEEAGLWSAILRTPGLIPHLYGKAEVRRGRKMGHVTRLFPRGALPGQFGLAAALGPLAPRSEVPSRSL